MSIDLSRKHDWVAHPKFPFAFECSICGRRTNSNQLPYLYECMGSNYKGCPHMWDGIGGNLELGVGTLKYKCRRCGVKGFHKWE